MTSSGSLRDLVGPRVAAAAERTPVVLQDPTRYATARLSPRERHAVEQDPRLRRLFLALDLLGPRGAPCTELGASIASMSEATLWRHFKAELGCTYAQFVRTWRVDAADALYRRGLSAWSQDYIAEQVGLSNRHRLRSAFLACRGVLPTGHAPRRAGDRRLLIAGVA